MATYVHTSKGPIDRAALEVIDQVTETEDARVIHTIWKDINNGEEVRRDVTVSILRSPNATGEIGENNG